MLNGKNDKSHKNNAMQPTRKFMTLFLFVDDAATALAVKTIGLQIQDLN